MNDVGQFLEDSYEVGDRAADSAVPKRKWSQMVLAADLLQEFNLWAMSGGHQTLNYKKFGDHMKELMSGSGTFGAGRIERIKLQEHYCYYPLVRASDRLGDD